MKFGFCVCSAWLAVCVGHTSSPAQGTFRSMDFELAQIPQNQPHGFVSADSAFPFWTVYYGTTPQTQVLWNDTSTGPTQVSLLGQNFGALAGGYSAYLFGGSSGLSDPLDCSISQVGQVPTDAVSLLFKAQSGAPGRELIVSMGGVSLPVFELSSGPNYGLYGVNVSQFASMHEDLRFTAPGFTPNRPNVWNIDDIVFSTTPVPEPTTRALLAAAGLMLGSRYHRRKP